MAGGGHNIPPDIIEQRYTKGLRNFFNLYLPLADVWGFYNNSHQSPEIIAEQDQNTPVKIHDASLWTQLRNTFYESPN